jgi:murein DD-endopeptidase MepM/ murein hydrolase activator NlpD
MDPYLRRIYLSVVIALVVLWVGMVLWAIRPIKVSSFSFASQPKIQSSKDLQDLSPLLQVPGIRFSIYHTADKDTFASVSHKFNLLETTLRSLNQANDETNPKVDSSLIIPSKDGIFHVTRPGQGLTDIAKAYGISLKEVLRANEKRGDSDVGPGQVLYLPGASYLSRKDLKWLFLASLETQKGFLKPTTGRFADGFGKRQHPITGKINFHDGLDLAPGWRARVVASQDGKVLFAGIRAGYGRLIILDHDGGVTSWYAHLDEVLVKQRQQVKRGELIGQVGKTGKVTGPHLHFEVRLNGKPQNPLLYLVQ